VIALSFTICFTMKIALTKSLALVSAITVANAFSISTYKTGSAVHQTNLFSSAPSDVDDMSIDPHDDAVQEERKDLKYELLQLCASYDRGFGATTKARKEVDEIIAQLEIMNPTPVNAARGVTGEYSAEGPAPLEGAWRMVWTTALDVLNLAASPIAAPGAIYQVFEPPIATNIIDLIPRIQSLLPTQFPPSLVRAEVKTRASLRPNNSNRVGLNFEAVKLVPVEVFGMKPDFLPPLNFNLPQIKLEDLPGADPNTAPGFFDVMYLDDEMLIIKQNAPGGYFAFIKVQDYDP
jgi:hypothetical protein